MCFSPLLSVSQNTQAVDDLRVMHIYKTNSERRAGLEAEVRKRGSKWDRVKERVSEKETTNGTKAGQKTSGSRKETDDRQMNSLTR